MGGWIALINSPDDPENRIDRFRKVFSVPNVPPLRINQDKLFPDLLFLSWAWNDHTVPDVHIASDSHVAVLLCGVITGFGTLAGPESDQSRAAQKLLDLWRIHGERLVPELNGSFSLLIYDSLTGDTRVFADRFASRTAWLSQEGEGFICGNFPSVLAACGRTSPVLDGAGLWSLLHMSRSPANRGLFRGMHRLLAGQRAFLNPKTGLKVGRWHALSYRPDTAKRQAEFGRELAHALRQSAGRYRATCSNPHLFLSGGMDSRLVAAAFGPPLSTITLCTRPNAESRFASLAARAVGVSNRTIVRSPYWYLECADAASLISGGSHFGYHVHFLKPMQEVLKQMPDAAFLLGDLMENFSKHYYRTTRDFPLFDPATITSFYQRHISYTVSDLSRIGRHIRTETGRRFQDEYNQSMTELACSVRDFSTSDEDRYDIMLRWVDVGITPTYNMISCIWPLAEERNLAFDNDLQALGQTIPAPLRGTGALHSLILMELNPKLLLVPDSNYFLPPLVPRGIAAYAKKVRPVLGSIRRFMLRRVHGRNKPVLSTSGSWLLLHELYRKDRSYRAHVEGILLDKDLFPEEIFDHSEIRRTWERFLAGDISLGFEVEGLLSFGSLNRLLSFGGLS